MEHLGWHLTTSDSISLYPEYHLVHSVALYSITAHRCAGGWQPLAISTEVHFTQVSSCMTGISGRKPVIDAVTAGNIQCGVASL